MGLLGALESGEEESLDAMGELVASVDSVASDMFERSVLGAGMILCE